MEESTAVQALSALAQASRLEVFRLLARAGTGGLPAGQIAEQLGISPATLSFHLKELMRAGLIDQRREGRCLIYTLNCDRMRALLGYLVEDCCQSRPELCQPDFRSSAGCGSTEDRGAERKRRQAGR